MTAPAARFQRRALIIAAIALAIVTGALLLRTMLKPALDLEEDSMGSGRVVDGSSRVLSAATLESDSQFSFTVHSVEPLPGARVIDAWLLTGPVAVSAFSNFDEPFDSAGEWFDRLAGPPVGNVDLPRPIVRDDPATIVVLWEIDDCAQLEEETPVSVELRDVVGLPVHARLPEVMSPRWAAVNEGSLICPTD